MSTATKTKPTATTLIERVNREFQAKLDELRPAAEEFAAVTTVWERLNGIESNGATVSPRIAARGRRTARVTPGAAKVAKRTSTKRGRPQGSGKRAQQAIHLLSQNGPMTTGELASKMGINSNYLYRVLPDMAKKGILAKNDAGQFSVL